MGKAAWIIVFDLLERSKIRKKWMKICESEISKALKKERCSPLWMCFLFTRLAPQKFD